MKKTITSASYHSLVLWLKACRKEQGLTLRDLGERLDVPHSWVHKVEKMERRLDVIEYVQMCESLNIDPMQGIEQLKHKKPIDPFRVQ